MRRKNRKFKQDEKESSASERADSSDLDNTNVENDNEESDSEPETKKRKSVSFSSKKGLKDKKEKEEKENSQADADNGDVQHEVEAVIDEKMVKGVKHFLIRWKGYSEDDDTWEPESTLSCPDLIKQFHASRKNNTNSKSKKGKEVKVKPKNKKKSDGKKRDSKVDTEEEEDWDENEEFEVDRIIEVHHKRDGSREFLVSWKGYPPSQNSWVVEEDMTCSDMVARFMAKVEKAKQSEHKDLRVKPAHTDRFTLSTKESGRRLSKRNSGRQSSYSEKVKLSQSFLEDLSASETEVYKEEELQEEAHDQYLIQENHETKHEVDTEAVSCYCSASHTDNISTDEHDSLKESQVNKSVLLKSLQSSDSGADLTECFRNEYEAAWQKYWSTEGEHIIWNSWISKYSDYINPEYLPNCNESNFSDNQKEEKVNRSTSNNFKLQDHSTDKFSFNKSDIERYSLENNPKSDNEHYSSRLNRIDETTELKDSNKSLESHQQHHHHHVLVRALSGSDSYDKLHTEISEGWNPLSPVSVEGETEAERLLSSQCGSHASSSARTVDSMTNVTHMTISSFELSDSSKITDSISSVSSVQSSLSSTSSEEIDDSANEYQQQWNVLWKKHYEEEYTAEYKKFMASIVDCDAKFVGNKILREVTIPNERKFNSIDTEKENLTTHEVGKVDVMLNSLALDIDEFEDNLATRDDSDDIYDNSCEYNGGDAFKLNSEQYDEMVAMGLPTCFGQRNVQNTTTKKSSETNQDLEATKDTHIKSAFKLMGLEYIDNKIVLKGHVDYKMKHIRLQNRHLKLHKHQNDESTVPKHIHFDDDGNIILENKEDDIEESSQVASDNSDYKQSTSSNNTEDMSKFQNLSQEESENVSDNVTTRRKRRKRKLNLPTEIKENPKLRKYWHRRFSLFHKFDQGVKLDEESWYSVTPEAVAKHTAQKLKCHVIIDAFCGAGGNSIQFAQTCTKVIAIDIDPKKIELAKNNAEIYGVADRIEFIIGDFFKLYDKLVADVIFLSPPWGGPSYLSLPTYELEQFLQPVPLKTLLKTARVVTKNIAIFLPRNTNTHPLLIEAGPEGSVEIEQNFINKKLIAITAYYNDLIRRI